MHFCILASLHFISKFFLLIKYSHQHHDEADEADDRCHADATRAENVWLEVVERSARASHQAESQDHQHCTYPHQQETQKHICICRKETP